MGAVKAARFAEGRHGPGVRRREASPGRHPMIFSALITLPCRQPAADSQDPEQAVAQGFKTVNNRPDFEGGPEQPNSAQMKAAAEALGLGSRLPACARGFKAPKRSLRSRALDALPGPRHLRLLPLWRSAAPSCSSRPSRSDLVASLTPQGALVPASSDHDQRLLALPAIHQQQEGMVMHVADTEELEALTCPRYAKVGHPPACGCPHPGSRTA